MFWCCPFWVFHLERILVQNVANKRWGPGAQQNPLKEQEPPLKAEDGRGRKTPKGQRKEPVCCFSCFFHTPHASCNWLSVVILFMTSHDYVAVCPENAKPFMPFVPFWRTRMAQGQRWHCPKGLAGKGSYSADRRCWQPQWGVMHPEKER